MTLNDGHGIGGDSFHIPPLDVTGLSPVTARALQLADEAWQNGVQEHPIGFNRGPEVDRYLMGVRYDGAYLLRFKEDPGAPDGWRGAPWCARFVRYCFDKAALHVGLDYKVHPLPATWGDLASAAKWYRAAARLGMLRTEPKKGYVGLILHENDTGHVVLVADVVGGGAGIITREGNAQKEPGGPSAYAMALLRPTDSITHWLQVD